MITEFTNLELSRYAVLKFCHRIWFLFQLLVDGGWEHGPGPSKHGAASAVTSEHKSCWPRLIEVQSHTSEENQVGVGYCSFAASLLCV